MVTVGAELFRLVDLGSLRLEATVPTSEIDRLKVGMPVEFEVSGYDRRFTGRIERINPAVDQTTGQVRIYVAIPNERESLVAGVFAEGRVGDRHPQGGERAICRGGPAGDDTDASRGQERKGEAAAGPARGSG